MHPLLKEIERENDPHDALEITPDVVLASRPIQEFPARAPEDILGPAVSAKTEPTGSADVAAPSLDAALRAEDALRATDGGSSMGTWARRAFVGFLLALCGVLVSDWQLYGDKARAMIASLAPQFVATSAPPVNASSAETPDIEATAAEAAHSQPAPPAESVAAAPPVPQSLEVPQSELLTSMARQIEQLKDSIEQLKSGQERMSRELARVSEAKAAEAKPLETKNSEQNVRVRQATRVTGPSPPAPRPAPARKPRPVFSDAYVPPPSPPAAPPPVAHTEPPPQAMVETDGNPVVRPPLPLR